MRGPLLNLFGYVVHLPQRRPEDPVDVDPAIQSIRQSQLHDLKQICGQHEKAFTVTAREGGGLRGVNEHDTKSPQRAVFAVCLCHVQHVVFVLFITLVQMCREHQQSDSTSAQYEILRACEVVQFPLSTPI